MDPITFAVGQMTISMLANAIKGTALLIFKQAMLVKSEQSTVPASVWTCARD
jgi:hypothetical protein